MAGSSSQVNGDSRSTSKLNSSDRLDKIDKLRAKNMGNHGLPLPQLVAVGDQSSGKSSLLENLTGIPFPRDETLCTRYATQITHRREDIPYINISIVPGPYASDDDKERLEAYTRSVPSTTELRAQFSTILEEVNKLMDIRTARNPSAKKTFTEDVLKIEKCGPDEDYLTIIDVPGIFRLTEEGVVTDLDKSLVRNMVEKYIKDSRTVILAVLPCTHDIFTQEILALAEKHDPKGERTLGILTKPDRLTENKAKAPICDLVNGKRKPLNLGYYLVRNKGADDDGDDNETDLAEREQIFKEEPWCSLPPDRVGVGSLRERLQDLLGQITDKSFPVLRMEIRHMMEHCERAMADLGDSRQTERDQQRYLTNIAGKFQTFVRAALEPDYSVDRAFASDDLRLITAVANLHDRFVREFRRSSHVYSFETFNDGLEGHGTASLTYQLEALDFASAPDAELEEFSELDGILSTDWTKQDPRNGIMAWIENIYSRSRGLDLFAYNSNLASSAFREQSAKWPLMTQQYLSKIIIIVHRFIIRALEHLCTDKRVFEQVKSTIMEGTEERDGLLMRYQEAMKQAMFLVDVERDKRPYTFNQDFYRLVDESSSARTQDVKAYEVQHAQHQHQQHGSTGSEPSGSKSKTTEFHKKLSTYYELASVRFLDNLFRQAVDHFLLSGPRSPLSVFDQQWVIELSGEKLASIAGEPRTVRETRASLERKIGDLRAAIKILQ